MASETIKIIVARIDERVLNIQDSISKIDSHLDRLNDSEGKQNVHIAKNAVKIGFMWKIGGGFLVVIAGILIKLLVS